ncbi:MAG: DUF983 domain-containing protein [Alphaproteobacteria bacterium]|nr:DUF983 domain-containing protein [Alphaproteobacteria bacterium]
MSAAEYPPASLLTIALHCRCPRCGKGPLFAGLLKVTPRCTHCGLDLAAEDAGDGPAVLVVFVLGAIVVAGALVVEALFSPPLWVHVVLWPPVTLGGAILLLRPLKAVLIAQQYRHRALGGGPATP